MVFIKITDGIEVRKFQVTPGEVTFQQLQEKIESLFPGAVKESSSLVLRYRDSDGDLITLSSDEEFQEVLSDLSNNHVLKLHIYTPLKNQEHQKGSFSQCPLRRAPWSDFDKQLKATEELLNLFFRLGDTSSSASEENTTTDENAEKSTSEENSGAPTSEDSAQPTENQDSETTGAQEDTKQATPKEGDDEEVKPKHPNKKTSGAECPAGRQCHVKRIHLWEPTLFGGLFGPRVWGPRVEYHITCAPKAQSTAASSA